MPLRIDGALLDELLTARGGREAFVDVWRRTSPDPHDRLDGSIISRWVAGEAWPKNSAKFLRLAALLDVDPFALLAPALDDPTVIADRLINIVQHRRSVPSALRFMHGFFGRQKCWPPVLEPDARPWYFREFEHDPTVRSNCKALMLLYGDPAHLKARPQAFHFAFRQPGRFGDRWLQYGTVFRHRLQVSLWHIGGDNQRVFVQLFADPTPVKTWLGPGAAAFKIASLHPFDLRLVHDPDDRPAVSFPG